jgi:hypothetical protein
MDNLTEKTRDLIRSWTAAKRVSEQAHLAAARTRLRLNGASIELGEWLLPPEVRSKVPDARILTWVLDGLLMVSAQRDGTWVIEWAKTPGSPDAVTLGLF